jgi:hypothetical protein
MKNKASVSFILFALVLGAVFVSAAVSVLSLAAMANK